MRIAIVHHHLRPGGVTRVIENAVASLRGTGHECVVLTGEACPADSPLSSIARTVEGLEYRSSAGGLTSEELATRLRTAADTPPPDLWHFHNHNLGKNLLIPDAVGLLATAQENILLQIHDFAEDGRPSNFAVANQAETLYPQAPSCHYAVLTSRDRQVLSDAGLSPERLHLLANPVAVPDVTVTTIPGDRRVLFYPTRGIRRKNIGEAVFLAVLLADHGVEVVTSRAPDNEKWLPVHSRWERFVEERRIQASLAVVDNPIHGGLSFGEWLGSSDVIVTTSITEGFGLAFLEPSLLGKPLVGRDLPDITCDFRAFGLTFPGLYQRLLVPLDWIDLPLLDARFEKLIAQQYRTYGRTPPLNATKRAIAAISLDGRIDFGGLDEPFQEAVIAHCLENPAAHQDVRILFGEATFPAAKWLLLAIASPVSEQSADILSEHFSLDAYGNTLRKIYGGIASNPLSTETTFDPGKVLSAFLSPEQFHCLKAI
jgi:glycosyltransferase involved in cell wall biosynthesis